MSDNNNDNGNDHNKEEDEKPYLSLAIIGQADGGKSTTMGHLIYQSGGVDTSTIQQYEQQATEIGKSSYKYAWLFDTLQAERERGITIDISLWKFESPRYNFTVIDTPGHGHFLKNMITGTGQADVALLVVDAAQGNFERGMSSTETGSTREHALLAYTLGVKQVIVAVNKMDDETVNYDQDRFLEIKAQVVEHLRKVGYKPMKIPFIPISGWKGDNLVEAASTQMPWYGGPSLLQALDNCTKVSRPTHKPLRIPIQDVYRVGGVGTVPVGRIEAGTLQPGVRLQFAPSGIQAECMSVERHHEMVSSAQPGDNVGFHSKSVSHKELARGHVASNADDQPAQAVSSFEAQIILLHHPGQISSGYTPMVDVHTAHVACEIQDILQKINRKTGQVVEESPEFLVEGDAAIVTMVPSKPLCVEPFADYPSLGRLVLRDQGRVVGVGVVKSVVHVKDEQEATS